MKRVKRTGLSSDRSWEMGIGNTTTSSAVACAILGLEPERMTGRGAGLSDEGLKKKQRVIRGDVSALCAGSGRWIGVLSAVGGLDLLVWRESVSGGAMYHVPVVLDGVITAAAALGGADYLSAFPVICWRPMCRRNLRAG